MKLRSKAFEKRLWAQVRQYDLRRRMSFWRRVLLALEGLVIELWVLRAVFFTGVVGLLFANRASIAAHAEVWIAGLGLWALLTTQVTGTIVFNSAADPQYRLLWMLPLPADRIYAYVARRVLLASLWVVAEFLVLYGLLVSPLKPYTGCAMVILCAGLQGAMSVAVALIVPRISVNAEKLQRTMATVWVMLIGIFIFAMAYREILHLVTKALYFCHPFGWINGMYMEGWIRGSSQTLWLVLPVLALFASIPSSLKSLRRLNADAYSREPQGIQVSMPGEKRAPLQSVDWTDTGLVGGLLGRLLDAREKVIATTLLINEPRWSSGFYSVLFYTGLILAANSLIRFESIMDLLNRAVVDFDSDTPKALAGCIASIIFFPFMLMYGISLFNWWLWPERARVGASTAPVGGAFMFRLLPLTYWEAAKVVAKVNTVVFLLLLPLAVVLSLTPIVQMFGTRPQGVGVFPKCLVDMWALTLFVGSLPMTGWNVSWRSFLRMATVFLAMFSVGVSVFMCPTLLLDVILMLLLVILTLGWLTYSGVRYCRGENRKTV